MIRKGPLGWPYVVAHRIDRSGGCAGGRSGKTPTSQPATGAPSAEGDTSGADVGAFPRR